MVRISLPTLSEVPIWEDMGMKTDTTTVADLTKKFKDPPAQPPFLWALGSLHGCHTHVVWRLQSHHCPGLLHRWGPTERKETSGAQERKEQVPLHWR